MDSIYYNEKLDIVQGKSNQAKIKPEKNIKLETKKEFFYKRLK
jgi:hypothetical protein